MQFLLDPFKFLFVQRIEFACRFALALRGDVDAEQRRLRDVDMTKVDQPREMPEEQRQQQDLNMRTIHIRIGKNDDFAVAQTGQIRRIANLVVIHADGKRNGFNLLVGVQRVGAVLPGVFWLALERQNGLKLLVARLLRRTTGGIAFDDEKLVALRVLGGAIGQLPRQHGHAGLFAPFHFLRSACARIGLVDDEFGDTLARVHMLVQPQLKRIAHHLRRKLDRVTRDQLVFNLALELRVEHFHRQHIRGARPYVLGDDFQSALAHGMQVNEILDRAIDPFAQAGHVRAANTRGDHVDIGLGDELAVRGPGDGPKSAFAFGEIIRLGLGGDVTFAEKRFRHGILIMHRGTEIALDAIGKVPGLYVELLVLLDS